MNRSRAALSGPYDRAHLLPFELPVPLDEAARLARWEQAARLEACQTELLSGLYFPAPSAPGASTLDLTYTQLGATTAPARALAQLTRPSHQIFQAQCDLLAMYADLREDRGAEIVAQVTWPIDFWASIVGLQAHRHRWTLELLDLATRLAVCVHMRFKHAFACPRPAELSAQIQPMIPTPGHASWPSGHATEAYLTMAVLLALLRDANAGGGAIYSEQMDRLAARIAVNRTVAGLHYPVDSAAGRLLGTALGEFFVGRCTGHAVIGRAFDGTQFHGGKGQQGEPRPLDFDPRVRLDNGTYYRELDPLGNVDAAPLLAFVWGKARGEWEQAK